MESKHNKFNISIYILIFIISVIPLIYLPFREGIGAYNIGLRKYEIGHLDNVYKIKIDILLYIEVILLFYMFYLLKNKCIKFTKDDSYISLTIFFTLLLVSTIMTKYKWIAIYGNPRRWEGLLAYIAYMLLFLFVINFVKKWNEYKLLIKSLLISAVIVSIYGFLQFLKVDLITNKSLLSLFHPRVYSTFGNPNFAASYISMILSISLVFFIYSKNIKGKLLYGILNSIYFSFMIATGTRGVWLTFIIVIFLMFWVLRKKIIKNYKSILILILIFVILFGIIDYLQGGLILDRISALFTDVDKIIKDNDTNMVGGGRMIIYRLTYEILFERPFFGSGLDTFKEVFPQEKFAEMTGITRLIVDKAHCEYLQLAVTVGFPALFAYLWFVGSILKRGYKKLKRKNKYQVALYFAMLAYLIQATVNISVVGVAPVFWAIMGLNVVIIKFMDKDKENLQEVT
ncbi:MAG: O-antigen ligase family protein [bacterium]